MSVSKHSFDQGNNPTGDASFLWRKIAQAPRKYTAVSLFGESEPLTKSPLLPSPKHGEPGTLIKEE